VGDARLVVIRKVVRQTQRREERDQLRAIIDAGEDGNEFVDGHDVTFASPLLEQPASSGKTVITSLGVRLNFLRAVISTI